MDRRKQPRTEGRCGPDRRTDEGMRIIVGALDEARGCYSRDVRSIARRMMKRINELEARYAESAERDGEGPDKMLDARRGYTDQPAHTQVLDVPKVSAAEDQPTDSQRRSGGVGHQCP